MSSLLSIVILVSAAYLDYLIGDPWHWWHPVQGMGTVINQVTALAWQSCHSPLKLRVIGVGLGLALVMASAALGWSLVALGHWVHPMVGGAIATILLASCFAGRSLRDAAEDVLQPLTAGRLEEARQRLARYVGRDTDCLSEPEVLRALLETSTENATDGVLAPLFYAIVGACLPGVGPLPLALAYKAASTLDSMVGYKAPPYTDIGWFSAKQDDVLTWLPCRLVVLTLCLLSGHPGQVWRLCQRDAPQDPSPNSGWSECAYAAVLGVQMGGTNWYRGVAKHKPRLGEAHSPITPHHLQQALRLTRISCLLWLGLGCGIVVVANGLRLI